MEPGEKKPEGAPSATTEGTSESGAEAPAKYVTEEQLHRVLGSRLGSFEQKFGKLITDTLGSFTTAMKTELATLLPAKPDAQPTDTKKKDAQAAPPESPELKRLNDQVAELTSRAEKAAQERDAERAKAKDSTLRQKVTDALVATGVDAPRARHALGLLVDSEKRIHWSEDGATLLFRRAEHDDVELGPGLKEWLKSEDGKFYLPPRGAAGSGDRGGASPPRSVGSATRAEVAEGLHRVVFGR